MANPTSNFNWQMPTASDLVTDLPADFEVFGQAVDTSLADLKGGTTGQVLSKTSGTDMDFTWVTTDDANAIQNSIVDAKGDLIAASANDTPARLAVGNNGETLVADSAATTGLRYQATQTAGKNSIINGNMAIAQRSTSASGLSTNDAFVAIDRWKTAISGTGFNITISRDTNVPNATFSYSQKVQQLSTSATSVTQFAVAQPIETNQVSGLYGKTATISFWYKSNLTGNHYLRIYTGSQTGGADSASAFNITTANTWQYVTVTTSNFASITAITNYSTGAQLDIGYRVYQGGTSVTISANDYFQFTGFQLELGSVATAFQTATGTIQGELAACQRYYFRSNNGGNAFARYGIGRASSATNIEAPIYLPVPMRVAPTSVDFSNMTTTTANNISAIALNQPTTNVAFVDCTASSLTTGQAVVLMGNNSTAAHLGFNAEL
jgi:hypothetical protein